MGTAGGRLVLRRLFEISDLRVQLVIAGGPPPVGRNSEIRNLKFETSGGGDRLRLLPLNAETWDRPLAMPRADG